MAHHGKPHHHHLGAREKLKLLKTPLREPEDSPETKHRHGDDGDSDYPRLKRYEEPTLLEIFYDLFFAANYNVFSENQDVTNHEKFKAYIGYFCLLWLTWFMTTAYDVRYLSDSILERLARALQLGVLVGFAVVTPNFDPGDQKEKTMRAMSIILMFSRAIIACEYGSALWHVRKYKKCRLPLYVMISINVVAMLVYLGVTFRFTDSRNSRVYMTWYFISGAEAILTLGLSNVWEILSFKDSHMMKRLSLLTVMILGDGLVNIAKEVVTIVKNPDVWDSQTIGLITGGVATVYFIFLIYFDWLRNSFYLPKIRQQVWIFLHLPFHVSLVLFMQAFTQYILWSKAVDVINKIMNSFDIDTLPGLGKASSNDISNAIKEKTDQFFSSYAPKLPEITDTVGAALKNISSIPDDFWPFIAKYDDTGNSSLIDNISDKNSDSFMTFLDAIETIFTSLTNNLFANFGIDMKTNVKANGPQGNGDVSSGAFQSNVNYKTWRRYRLVFAYGYIAAGCCLLFMSLLYIVAHTTRWRKWPIIRLVLVLLLALGTGLVATLWFSKPKDPSSDDGDLCLAFLMSPWVLPTITIVFTVVLVITHIGGHYGMASSRGFTLFRKKKQYDSVSLPMTPSADWKNSQREGEHQQVDDQKLSDEAMQADERGWLNGESGDYGRETIGVAHGEPNRPQTGYDPLRENGVYRRGS